MPDYVAEWGELYVHYSNGFLMLAGGIGDQPEWYLKAMVKFSSAYNKAAEERRERTKQ